MSIIDFELFRPILNKASAKERKNAAGRPPFDCILMFKVLVLQRLFNLSDEQTEYQINDRMSFMRFLGLGLGDRIPDEKTIWLFKDTLSKAGVIEALFREFNRQLETQGIITHKGTIIDATFVDAPRQRNTRNENKAIKEGQIPEEWTKDTPEAKHKLAQKDTDARWTVKNKETHYGYKDHVKADADSKIIVNYAVTPASVHDSNEFTGFLNESDETVYADSAYAGKDIPANVKSEVCEKGYRNKKLTAVQITENRRKSKIRCRIEHIFGFMTGSMNGITVRSIGARRADFNIGLTNLVYNLCRYTIIKRKAAVTG